MASSSAVAPRSKPPTFGTAVLDGVAVIEIGAKRKKYHIHKAFLVHHSEYFAKALNGPWKEAEEGVVTLEDVDPAIFNIYTHWLYQQQLPDPSSSEWITIIKPTKAITGDPTVPESTQYFFHHVKAYGLADRILDSNFRRVINGIIVRDTSWALSFPACIDYIIQWAFENIASNRPVLQFLVNHFCEKWHDVPYESSDARSLKKVPPEFSARVMRRFAELRRPETPRHEDACYVEHVSSGEKKACRKPHVRYDPDGDYGYLEVEED